MDRAEQLKQAAQEQIAAHRGELEELSLRIHDNPELSLEEEKSSQWLAEYLAGNGFEVTKPAYGLPTAFEAVYGKGSPSIGIIAEYDALPGIGHACGHNVIATAALGAGLAAKAAADAFGATIRVIGTPGEEGRGGKIRMARNGAFRNVDAAMMVHPGDYNTSGCEAMAVAILSVEFHGKASHAAGAPQQGVNALEAMIISYNAINSLRQHVVDGSRVHGIITDGGQAANVVPAHSAGLFYIRAKDDEYVETLKERVVGCFEAGAKATGGAAGAPVERAAVQHYEEQRGHFRPVRAESGELGQEGGAVCGEEFRQHGHGERELHDAGDTSHHRRRAAGGVDTYGGVRDPRGVGGRAFGDGGRGDGDGVDGHRPACGAFEVGAGAGRI